MTQQANEAHSVFERPSVTVTMRGREYKWTRPSMAVARRWRKELRPVLELMQRFQDTDPGDVSLSTVAELTETADLFDGLLAFFYAHHPEMAKDHDIVDDASDAELINAFTSIWRVCLVWSDEADGAEAASKQDPLGADADAAATPSTSESRSGSTNSCSPSGASPGTTSTSTGPSISSSPSPAP